jgi:hypothetical protein
MSETAVELARQFPLVAVTLLVSWYFMRQLTRQQERELEAKTREIDRLLAEKKQEIDRLLEERRKYFQLFLKELKEMNQGPPGEGGSMPSKPK